MFVLQRYKTFISYNIKHLYKIHETYCSEAVVSFVFAENQTFMYDINNHYIFEEICISSDYLFLYLSSTNNSHTYKRNI